MERTTSLIRRDKVIAVSGPITSNNRDAMMPTLSRAKVPLLYATNYEGGGCNRYLFSFNTVPNQELEKLLPAMKERAGSSFYMFGADYVWPQKMFEAAGTIIKGFGGTVAGSEFTPWGVKEFAPVIRRIKDSGAKVLVFALPGADGITFIRQAEELGLLKDVTVAFLGFAETYLGAFGENKGQNMWVTVPFAASLDLPGVKEFVAKIRKSAGESVPISHYAFTHYNSLIATKAALEKSGKPESEALVDGLEGLTIDSPTGKVTIGKDHHVTMEMFLAKTEGAGPRRRREAWPDCAEARLRVILAGTAAPGAQGRGAQGGERPFSRSPASSRSSAASSPSTASTSCSRRARCAPSSGRTAAARRPCST